MTPLPRGLARATLVVAVHGCEILDHRGDVAKIVRQAGAPMQHDHGRPPSCVTQRPPAKVRPVDHWRETPRLPQAHRRQSTGDTVQACEPECHPVFVAEDTDGSVIGFVSVGSRLRWSGETDAYVSELAVA